MLHKVSLFLLWLFSYYLLRDSFLGYIYVLIIEIFAAKMKLFSPPQPHPMFWVTLMLERISELSPVRVLRWWVPSEIKCTIFTFNDFQLEPQLMDSSFIVHFRASLRVVFLKIINDNGDYGRLCL